MRAAAYPPVVVLLYATAFLSLGLVNLDFGRHWLRGQRIRLAVGVPLVVLYVYFEMPALVFPQAFTLLLLTLVPNAAYALILGARSLSFSRRVVTLRRRPSVPYATAIGVLGAFALVLAFAPIVDAGGLRDIVAADVSQTLPPSADLRAVRVVPVESAIFTGDKVIGQLGAYYSVGTYNVQATNGHLVWVAPLEYQGIIQWLSRRSTPGVIVVSAQSAEAPAELRLREPMRYVPSAYFNENLYRHVYLQYGTEQILELTLQLDDTGAPQYLATLGRPTIGWSGQRVTGVAIVDPATGAMRRIDRSDFANLPRWVSRVYPSDLALEYNTWFGRFVHGFWNALIAKRDVHVPARDEVFGLLAGSNFVWFVDHTSPANDQSMTGFTYMDSVSGHMTYYTSSGGEFNSLGAENAVASNPLVKQGRLIPRQPLLYTAFGQNTWVVPLVADTGKFQSLALVEARSGRVTIGDAQSASPRDDAFTSYARFLHAGAPAGVSAQEENGTIDRIAASAAGSVYFTVRGNRRVFTIAAADATPALLARPGDRVRFRIHAGDTGATAVDAFRDEALVQ